MPKRAASSDQGHESGEPRATEEFACVLSEPDRLDVVPQPHLEPGPLEVRCSVTKASICGTDLAILRGDYRVPLPLIPGHEWVGTVEEVGREIDPGLVGMRVVAEISVTCRSRMDRQPCEACAKDLHSHCLRRTVAGITGAAGCWATQIVVPAGNLHFVPTTVQDNHAVFVEPLAAAIQTFELAPIYPGDHVVVLGVGRLGSLITQVARLRGARVAAVSRSDARLRLAAKLGAREALKPGPKLVSSVKRFCGGLGADVVVEATGSPDGLKLALELVRPRGTVALKSTCGLESRIDQTMVVVNEVQLSSSRCGPFDKAISMLREGSIRIAPLIAGEFPLSEIRAAVEAATGVGKVLLRPR